MIGDDLKIKIQKQKAPLDRRDAKRVHAPFRITFVPEAGPRVGTEKGMLADISMTGCKIASRHPPMVGSKITLFLDLQDGQPCLCLPDTSVCRVVGEVFGVQFPAIASEDRRRLQALVLKWVTQSDSPEPRTAFRIV
jgi:c-di-GMP-binding flagellar brake protein YcgR